MTVIYQIVNTYDYKAISLLNTVFGTDHKMTAPWLKAIWLYKNNNLYISFKPRVTVIYNVKLFSQRHPKFNPLFKTEYIDFQCSNSMFEKYFELSYPKYYLKLKLLLC